ncbi:Uncharacterised protein [uncultured archaeon]|nr:Uncharacterised protein [uncultured archaeon]
MTTSMLDASSENRKIGVARKLMIISGLKPVTSSLEKAKYEKSSITPKRLASAPL